MALLTATKVSKFYGADEIFSNITVEIPHRARIAIVGANGAGKTTLIKLFIGEEVPTEGQVSVAKQTSIAYLPQRPELAGNHTVWDEQLTAFTGLMAMEVELGELAMRLDEPDVIEAYGKLQEQFELLGGYDYETRIKMVLSGVGFSQEDYDTPLSQLSGGQKTRVMLARLLLQSPDILILDEPTNHLDIYAVEWLEGFLNTYDGAVVAISHDRRFVDNFAKTVWEMEFHRLETYRGNYTHYMQQRDERRERLQKEYEKQQEFIAKEMDYIRKHMGSRWTAQAKGRLKKLQTMQKRGKIIDSAPQERDTMNLQIEAGARSGDEVIVTRDLTIGYDDPLFSLPDVLLERGETAAIIGGNGAGKSTLLKTLIGELDALNGSVKLGAQVHIGYFAQAHEGMNSQATVIDEIMEAGGLNIPDARQFLGAYLFSGEDVFRTISTLSGGERGRVALAKLALSGANLLLLDEPTNHLDMDSQEILQAVIEGFEGTVLLVSHDRYLIDALASQIWAITPQGTADVYNGTFGEYMQHRRQMQEREVANTNGASGSRKQAAQYAEKVRGMSPYQLQNYVSELEAQIDQLEAQQSDVTAQLEVASASGDGARVQELGVQYAELEAQLENAMQEWEDLAPHLD